MNEVPPPGPADSPHTQGRTVLHSLKYAYTQHSFGHGWLLPMSIDEFERICSAAAGTMSEILKQQVTGTIAIEYGGKLPGVSVSAKQLAL